MAGCPIKKLKMETKKTGNYQGNGMKKIVLAAVVVGLAGLAQAQFLPKHLAVLRAGDGAMDLHLKQSPIFIDEFLAGTYNDAPVMTVAVPTNGPQAFFFNGHAATEGMLSLSADGRRGEPAAAERHALAAGHRAGVLHGGRGGTYPDESL
jgi:hypothetical protein